jgi:hypothetical protein
VINRWFKIDYLLNTEQRIIVCWTPWKFLYNKTNQMHQFPKFTPAWNTTCFGQFLCPSSGVYSHVHSALLYVIQVWRQLSSRSICSCSKAVYKPVWHKPLLSVQWMYSWWWTEEFSETCRVSCQNELVKLVHLVGFIIKKFRQSFVKFLDQHYELQAHSPNKLYANICRCLLRSPTLVRSTRQPVLRLTFLNNNDFVGYWEVVNLSQEN